MQLYLYDFTVLLYLHEFFNLILHIVGVLFLLIIIRLSALAVVAGTRIGIVGSLISIVQQSLQEILPRKHVKECKFPVTISDCLKPVSNYTTCSDQILSLYMGSDEYQCIVVFLNIVTLKTYTFNEKAIDVGPCALDKVITFQACLSE